MTATSPRRHAGATVHWPTRGAVLSMNWRVLSVPAISRQKRIGGGIDAEPTRINWIAAGNVHDFAAHLGARPPAKQPLARESRRRRYVGGASIAARLSPRKSSTRTTRR